MRRVFLLALVFGVAAAIFWHFRTNPLLLPRACSAEVNGMTANVSSSQAENAALISAISQQRKLPPRAASIAIAVAIQESKLQNIDYGDRDSAGIFQQRPSQGWGTFAQVTDPVYATNKFYDALIKVENYQSMRITEAGQAVQRSGFPEAYEDHAAEGRALAASLTGEIPQALTCTTAKKTTAKPKVAQKFLGEHFTIKSQATKKSQLKISPANPRNGWAIAQISVAYAANWGISEVKYRGFSWKNSAGKWVKASPANQVIINFN